MTSIHHPFEVQIHYDCLLLTSGIASHKNLNDLTYIFHIEMSKIIILVQM